MSKPIPLFELREPTIWNLRFVHVSDHKIGARLSEPSSLPEVSGNDIPCSIDSLKAHFADNSFVMLKAFRAVAPDPRTHPENQLELPGDNARLVVYKRFRASNGLVQWCFSKADKEAAKNVLLPFRTDLKGLSRCTEHDINEMFFGDPKRVKQSILANLPDIHSVDAKYYDVQGDNKTIRFWRVKSTPKGKLIWAFDRSAAAHIASWTSNKLSPKSIPKGKASSIAVSGAQLKPHFPTTYVRVRDTLLQALPDPLTAKESSWTLVSAGGKVRFNRVLMGQRIQWTFARRDLEKVGLYSGAAARTQIPPLAAFNPETEVSLTQNGLRGIVIGIRERFAAVEKLMARRTRDDATEVEIASGFTIFRRQHGKSTPWCCHISDLQRLASAANLPLRSTILFSQSDVPISQGGLRPLVEDPERIARQINSELGDVTASQGQSKAIKIDGQTLTFRPKLNDAYHVWTCDRSELPLLAKKFDFSLRTEVYAQDGAIADAMALLGKDPKVFLRYLRIFHPEIRLAEAGAIALEAFKGLSGSPSKMDFSGFSEELEAPVLQNGFSEVQSKDSSIVIEGTVDPRTEYIQVSGDYSTRIRIYSDGTFRATVPLPNRGELNEFNLLAVNEQQKLISEPLELNVLQTGSPVEPEQAFEALCLKREQALQDLKRDPVRYNYLLSQLELSLLGHFTESESRGFKELDRRIAREKSESRLEMLKKTKLLFEAIAAHDYGVAEGTRLYFFQKYTVHKILEAIRLEEPGILVAHEQGLGKTLTALAATREYERSIICPNSVLTTWGREERTFFDSPTIAVLEGPYRERDEALRSGELGDTVTNVEYTRNLTATRRAALSKPTGIVIVDEADYLGTNSSQQARGTKELDAAFRLLLSATPFKRISQIGVMLATLDPTSPIFNNPGAFSRAFNVQSPRALDALHILMDSKTLRIRKDDVFRTFDPGKPLEGQKDRLPAKVKIDPEDLGAYTLSHAQCESILKLLTNYQEWCREHRGHDTYTDSLYYRFNEGFFPKREALRQIMNSPSYFGNNKIESPKHQKMDRIVRQELDSDNSNKLLIFCRYREQVEEYQRRYAAYGACTYYGGTRSDANGYKIDDKGNLEFFAADERGEFVLDSEGTPIKSDTADGKPMRALDYETTLFQNSPHHRVMIATYDAGAVGVTFTAAHAVVYDDLAPTYRDEYQAGDRAHRIDNDRKKYEIRYYWLQARYPESFLRTVRGTPDWQYFEHGTYDEIFNQHIRSQERVFHKIMDVIGADDVLENQVLLRDRMPFMFSGVGTIREEIVPI